MRNGNLCLWELLARVTGYALIYSSSGSEIRAQRSLGDCSISVLTGVLNSFYHRPFKVDYELCPISQKPLFRKVTAKSFRISLFFCKLA